MHNGFLKKKLALFVTMSMIGSMLFGMTAMAATSYSFSVNKGEYGYAGSGTKTNSSQSFTINVTRYSGKGNFFICVLEGNDQVGTDVTVSGTGSYSGSYYKTAYNGRTYRLMGFYDDLQDPVSAKCTCGGTWIP